MSHCRFYYQATEWSRRQRQIPADTHCYHFQLGMTVENARKAKTVMRTVNTEATWKLQPYLNAVGPIADVGETLRGSDVVHQEKRLGSVENLPGDAVKPLTE